MGAGGQVFRVMLRLQVHPGMEADFERTWLRIGSAVADHPAGRGQWLLRGAQEPSTYYITSDWADEPQFREFEHSDVHLGHRQLLAPFRAGISMTTMHVVHDLPAAAVRAR